MSVEAITWALSLEIKHSTSKFVLVALANCANGDLGGDLIAWPSHAYLSKTTGQDRKTVWTNLKRLTQLGLISDTGQREGGTKQVIVYRLHPLKDANTGSELKIPENGTLPNTEQFQNSLERIPFFPPKSPKNGIRNRNRTVKEPIEQFVIPNWIPVEVWKAFLEMRKNKRVKDTAYSLGRIVKKLEEFKAQGHDPAAILDTSIINCWTDVYLPKPQTYQKAPQQFSSRNLQV